MSQAEAAPELLWDLVEESLDEAEFLWRRWDLALSSHSYDLRGVSYWLEERLLGSIEGIRVAGDAAIETMLAPALLGEEPSRASTAAYVLGSARTPIAIDALTAAFRGSAPDQLAPLRRGIELVAASDLPSTIRQRIPDVSPELRAAMLDASSFGHRDPGAKLLDLVTNESPLIQRAVARAARHAPREIGEQCASYGVHYYADPAARAAAVETGLIFGLPPAWQICAEGAAAGAPGSEPLLLLVALLGNEADHEKIFRALQKEDVQKAAVFALGFAGTMRAADACIDLMGKGIHPQLAADSFCTITGLDLDRERLTAPVAEQEEPVPIEDENLDADLVPSAEALLPLPDVARVTGWWGAQRSRFYPTARYLGGIPVNLTTLYQYLERGVMRRRQGIALELAIRTGGRFQVETRTFTTEQRRQIATFASLMSFGIPPSPLASLFSPV